MLPRSLQAPESFLITRKFSTVSRMTSFGGRLSWNFSAITWPTFRRAIFCERAECCVQPSSVSWRKSQPAKLA